MTKASFVKHILSEARKVKHKGNQGDYLYFRRRLDSICLPPDLYEYACNKLARILKV